MFFFCICCHLMLVHLFIHGMPLPLTSFESFSTYCSSLSPRNTLEVHASISVSQRPSLNYKFPLSAPANLFYNIFTKETLPKMLQSNFCAVKKNCSMTKYHKYICTICTKITMLIRINEKKMENANACT